MGRPTNIHPSYDPRTRSWFLEEPVSLEAPSISLLLVAAREALGGPVRVLDYYPGGRPADLDIRLRDTHFNVIHPNVTLSKRAVGTTITAERRMAAARAVKAERANRPIHQLHERLGTPGRPSRPRSAAPRKEMNRSYDPQVILDRWARGDTHSTICVEEQVSLGTVQRVLKAARVVNDPRAFAPHKGSITRQEGPSAA